MGGCCCCVRSMRASRSLARCFYDARNPLFIEHSVRELVAQRLLGMAAGYEDLNDHNLLRLDPLFAVAVGKEDPLGSGRAPQDQGKALASASTLNRLELGNNKNTRCHKISADHEAIEDTLLLKGARCLPKDSLEVIIDLDTTDDPLHGHQEGRFFHGFLWLLLLPAAVCLCRFGSTLGPTSHQRGGCGSRRSRCAKENRFGGAKTLSQSADHCARRQRFLSRRDY